MSKIVYRDAIYAYTAFIVLVLLSFISFQTGCAGFEGFGARAYRVCNESDATNTGKLILEVRL